MARLLFPDEGSRLAFSIGTSNYLQHGVGSVITFYTNPGCTILADVQTVSGLAVPSASFTIGTDSLVPQFLGPADGTDTLYAKNGTHVSVMHAEGDARLDALVAGVAAAETPAGAQAKANSAQATAISAAAVDATTKANSAQTAATAAAATDATTKVSAQNTTALATFARTSEFAASNKLALVARHGVNVAGAEFGNVGDTYGTSWKHENLASFQFLAGRGHRLVRYPFKWERIQPTLSGPLDTAEQARLVAAVDYCRTAGVQVVLDVHNYGSYNAKALGDTGVSGAPMQADFVDLWNRLSDLFRDHPAVVGYGLMNEPRNLPLIASETGRDRWKTYSQAVVTSIRARGDVTCICVGGYSGSAIGTWFNATSGTPDPWITDPINNTRYEAHAYWDSSGGVYSNSYAAEDTVNISFGSNGTEKAMLTQLRNWAQWLESNNLKGFLGEFGWPRNDIGANAADAPLWDALADKFLKVVESYGDSIWTTSWGTGSTWSAGYNLNPYSSTAGVLSGTTSVAPTLEKYQTKIKRPSMQPQLAQPKMKDYIVSSTPWRGASYDQMLIASAAAIPLGQPIVSLIKMEEDGPISNLLVFINVSAVTPTVGQCFAAIYDSSGVQLGITADISGLLTGVVTRSLPLITPTKDLTAGTKVYGALLVNATTACQIGRYGQLTGAIVSRRFGLGATGLTALPATQSPGALTAATSAFWMGVS